MKSWELEQLRVWDANEFEIEGTEQTYVFIGKNYDCFLCKNPHKIIECRFIDLPGYVYNGYAFKLKSGCQRMEQNFINPLIFTGRIMVEQVLKTDIWTPLKASKRNKVEEKK